MNIKSVKIGTRCVYPIKWAVPIGNPLFHDGLFVPDSSERSFPTSNESFSFQIRSSMPPTRHLSPSLTATVSTFFQGAIFSSLKAEEAPGSLKSIKNAKEKTWKSKRLYFERWAERAAQGHGAWARLRGFWRFFIWKRTKSRDLKF